MTQAPRRGRRTLAPTALVAVGALVASGCFATRNDVRVLQTDVAAFRTEMLRSDSARAAQLDRVIAQLGVAGDSLRAASARAARFQGDTREAMRSLGEQLIQVQELTGQSQRRLQELRASMEARATETAAPVAADSTGAGPAPGPNQLYQLAFEQFRRGSMGTARAGFQDLLTRYPTADVAADAQFYLAETYAGERNAAAADSAYAAVVTRYPSSPRAPTALYKRARALQTAGKTREARAMYEELVRRWPRSDEAVLARDALKAAR